METQTGDRNIKSIVKAANIIDLLSEAEAPLSLGEIANRLDMQKSTLHGILATLCAVGFVAQSPENGRYRLSDKLFELGNKVAASWNERKLAYPYMKRIVAQTGEAVHMAVLEDGDVLYIQKQESEQSIRIVTDNGVRLPPHCSGVGKVLLSGLSDSEIQKLVRKKGLVRYTDRTITDFDSLMTELETVRRQGYALDDQEFMIGLKCVAVPIADYHGKIKTALSISAPVARMDGERLERNRLLLQEAADAIMKQLKR